MILYVLRKLLHNIAMPYEAISLVLTVLRSLQLYRIRLKAELTNTFFTRSRVAVSMRLMSGEKAS